MDLKSLRCFCVLAETLNFREAARHLNLTQPALSLRLQRLEDELGFRLLERSRSRVALSDGGREFLPHARALLRQAAGTRAFAAKIASGAAGRLRIGYTPLSFFGDAPAIVRAYAGRRPEVDLVLEEMLSGEIETALSAGDLDVGFLHPPVHTPGLAVRQIGADPFILAVNSWSSLAAQDQVEIAQLADQELIMVGRAVGPAIHDSLMAMLHRHGVAPRIRQEVTTSIATLGLVAAGHGVGLVIAPMSCVQRPELVFRPLAVETPTLPLAVAHATTARARVVADFLEILSEVVGQEVPGPGLERTTI